ncbi:hypothetical protein GCM10027569_18820 [Flindersiella endophytica]
MGCLVLLLLASGPAFAGGPTSVLLVSPGNGRTASLYTSEPAYGQLLSALGENPVAERGGPSWHSNPGTSQINVTWLVHDVSVWRVDRIVLDYNGTTWIETQGSLTETVDWDKPGIWHKAQDPAVVRALVTELGLVGKAVAKPQPTASVEPSAAPVAAQSPANVGSGGLSGWWLLPAAIVGLALGLAARPALTHLRAREPHQQLIDVQP